MEYIFTKIKKFVFQYGLDNVHILQEMTMEKFMITKKIPQSKCLQKPKNK